MKKIFLSVIPLILFWAPKTMASGIPNLSSLSQAQVNSISKEFSANFVHTIIAPASSLGNIFGIEAGLMGGITNTPSINSISTSLSSSATLSKIPTLGIIGAVSMPFGLGAEVNFIPSVTVSSLSVSNASVGFRWTMTNLFKDPFFDFAFRGHYNTGEIAYTTVINNSSTSNQDVNTKVAWKNSSYGYNFILSKKILFIEPYIGFGQVSSSTGINISGASTVTIFTFTSSSSYTSKNSGSQTIAGVNLNLFITKFGAEYTKVMGVTKYTGKWSFYF
jgi:hypothetical protein